MPTEERTFSLIPDDEGFLYSTTRELKRAASIRYGVPVENLRVTFERDALGELHAILTFVGDADR